MEKEKSLLVDQIMQNMYFNYDGTASEWKNNRTTKKLDLKFSLTEMEFKPLLLLLEGINGRLNYLYKNGK